MLSYLCSSITFFDGLMLLNWTVNFIFNLLVPPVWNYNVITSQAEMTPSQNVWSLDLIEKKLDYFPSRLSLL